MQCLRKKNEKIYEKERSNIKKTFLTSLDKMQHQGKPRQRNHIYTKEHLGLNPNYQVSIEFLKWQPCHFPVKAFCFVALIFLIQLLKVTCLIAGQYVI